ncbi:MAG: YqaE/Pmp3 family membrane protein [Chitinophagales bacterium]|jgi:uncharacterized membrane protein YqaE (UPF0057 family)|nr:YqaE/Pmp3 family membrane protein [Chitinophagales bacterium]
MKKIFVFVCFALGLLAAPSVEAAAFSKPAMDDSTTLSAEESILLKESVQSFQSLSKKERKQRLQEAKKALRELKAAKAAGESSDNQVLAIIFAILIPPVGVIIKEKGQVTTKFWISLLLTLLFWLPGAIYALLVVTGNA